eukprot:m.10335 g.10335  ORF g.10335 m.10335 type:complete len:286 (+) comp7335_c0_seq1:352-1209(+)
MHEYMCFQQGYAGPRGIFPWNNAKVYEAGDRVCRIGDVWQVSFTRSLVESELGDHLRLPPLYETPVRFRMEDSEVQVSTYFWLAKSQEVLCLRCREVVSDAAAFFDKQTDAMKPCFCDTPSDLLEPYSGDKNISSLRTQMCADSPDQMETRMLLCVPRYRADPTQHTEWFHQLPCTYVEGRKQTFKTILIKVQVVPENANNRRSVYMGSMRLCDQIDETDGDDVVDIQGLNPALDRHPQEGGDHMAAPIPFRGCGRVHMPKAPMKRNLPYSKDEKDDCKHKFPPQ